MNYNHPLGYVAWRLIKEHLPSCQLNKRDFKMKKLFPCLAITFLTATISPLTLAVDTTTAAPMTTSTTTTTTNATKVKPMSMSTLLQQLQKAGYIVKSVDYSSDDGVYKVDAIDRHGEKQSVDINASTGLSADQKKNPQELSMAQAVKKLEKNGASVTSISIDDNAYKATVMDNKGNKQDYSVDMLSGKVTQ